MIGSLKGLPGKAKAIYDYLTTHLASARAAKIDNLDAAISTRAAASTALSNATWTNALAALLGNTIQTSVIQSIQTGYVAASPAAGSGEDLSYTDITISAVVVGKCLVFVHGQVINVNSLLRIPSGRLTSPTNLRVSLPQGMGGNVFANRWYVVEFK